MTREANIWAIIPAAGAGVRMQADMPKQYLPLLGRPIIVHTLERLCAFERLHGVLVGVAAGDPFWAGLSLPKIPRFLGVFEGGASRAHTVVNGIDALQKRAESGDWVMVHDAVRPCIRHTDLDRLVDAALGSVDGALLAMPVADTVKRADAGNRVSETVTRDGLWRALTPQMFPLERLNRALRDSLARNENVTDDSLAIERTGARPLLVEGRPDNIKITHPSDLALAELFLRRQQSELG